MNKRAKHSKTRFRNQGTNQKKGGKLDKTRIAVINRKAWYVKRRGYTEQYFVLNVFVCALYCVYYIVCLESLAAMFVGRSVSWDLTIC